jgi:hypothetical protein
MKYGVVRYDEAYFGILEPIFLKKLLPLLSEQVKMEVTRYYSDVTFITGEFKLYGYERFL